MIPTKDVQVILGCNWASMMIHPDVKTVFALHFQYSRQKSFQVRIVSNVFIFELKIDVAV